jgi:hypothetical protein
VSRFFGFRIESSRFFKGIWFWIIGLPAYQFVIVEYFHFWISIFSFIISPSLCYH